MDKIRIGNDIEILWAIYAEQEGKQVPYDLTGRKLTLYVSNQLATWKVDNFEVSENAIRWIFLGKDQKHIGAYTLTLIENEGMENMHTVDVCNAFRLVNRTCKFEKDEDNVNNVTLRLSSDFFVEEPINKIFIDSELSLDSANPVENRVITKKINDIEATLMPDTDKDVEEVWNNIINS
jgi:hypothetical protein